jgi:hypothetical protein
MRQHGALDEVCGGMRVPVAGHVPAARALQANLRGNHEAGGCAPDNELAGGALLQPDAERRCRSRARVGRQLFVVVDIKQSLGALHCPETAHGSGRHVVVDHDVGLRLRREGSVSRTHGHGAKAVEVDTKYPF